ncbi:class I adenylate-forming enzyme family protein [Streptomyces sp. NPDC047043]|uniref:class I adenylate-forming enzyme family protein n=1 Tax=Streptomyces sp. NPDC047043 TaxID=3154497 RepID=UPI0033E8F829
MSTSAAEPVTGAWPLVPDGAVADPPAHATVIASLLALARSVPQRPFLTWCPDDGDPQVLTYGDLERRSRRLASALTDRLPAQATMALLPGNDIPSVVAVFAALRAGMPCLFLNPGDPVRRLRSILDEHQVATVLCSPFAGPEAKHVADTVLDPDDDPQVDPPTDAGLPGDSPVPASRPAFLFGTSGSTAASKLVVQPHRALTSNAEAVRRHHGLDGHTTLLGGLPIHHVNGVHFTLVAPVHAGAHVVLPQHISPFTYRALLDNHRPHIASVVPPVLRMLLATGRGWRPPSSLRYFVSAAAPLTRSLAREVVDVLGVRVLQGYGLSEATNFSTTVPHDLSEDAYRAVMLDAEIPSVGIAVHGNEVEVFGPGGTRLGEGEPGEIRIRGHNLMAGYAGRPGLTADALCGGWLRTGDIGYWATGPDGRRYFHLTGRTKNVAKVRGESVSLEEVERALLSIPAVEDAAVLALPHETSDEELLALVVAPAGDLSVIRDRLARLLPAVALPAHWHELDRIPRTATGKLRRPGLAERFAPEAAR